MILLTFPKSNILELLRELIRIPSVNPTLAPEEGHNEVKIAEFVVDWLRKHNVDARIEFVEPGRPNVFAEVGDGEGPTLCLCAHLDTVGTAGMEIDPFDPKIEGNRVYGRGSCDMKAGVAAIMSTAASLAAAGSIKGKVILALVCDEEYASIGADHFVLHHRADACILTEPSDLKMVVAHKGFLWGKVTTTGRSAHGSRWDLGDSAISKMGNVIVGLDNLDKNVLRNRREGLVGPESMHVSLISGGIGVSTYAPDCTIHIERRTLPSENTDDVKSEIERVIQNIAKDSHIDWYFKRDSFSCAPNESIIQHVTASYKSLLGSVPESVGWGGWTDAAIFQQAGIPTINIGASGFGLHEPVEWIDFETVLINTNILINAATTFLQDKKVAKEV
ncbi:M20 family metallopeptidase [Aneurinibacillus aneurinilyticus]|jgi:acetylornithine deacetylase|uniref:M20 family metallopeptidase n=1 Tax=Aneurinibacillus aneurinilyticus TaxID=1391 RepID=UPI0023F6C5D9|nr:ArgE/DapE family deacylase [Aneurinibacillus aneurinilyticus]MCI1696326.1 ArgE/DapE family deacylase [Aneurinibacillus aneurinilyticus]